MHKKRWRTRWLIVVLVVGALLVGAVGVVSAHGGPPGWWGGKGIDRDALLAEELGITVERLQAAREAARARALQQALEQGLITQEQYDQLQLQALVAPYLEPQKLMAAALGIEPAQLAEKSLQQWLDELDLDRATLQERLRTAYEAALAQAVKDGVITQEQADTLKDKPFPLLPGPPARGRGCMPFMEPPACDGWGMRGGNCPQGQSENGAGVLRNNNLRMWRMGALKRF